MDTNVLKTFIAVCEYSGFSAAAKELGYTQSTDKPKRDFSAS